MYYEITVKGHVSKDLFEGIETLNVTWEQDATTKLCGELVDQAALYGLLRQIRDLGIELYAITPDEMV